MTVMREFLDQRWKESVDTAHLMLHIIGSRRGDVLIFVPGAYESHGRQTHAWYGSGTDPSGLDASVAQRLPVLVLYFQSVHSTLERVRNCSAMAQLRANPLNGQAKDTGQPTSS